SRCMSPCSTKSTRAPRFLNAPAKMRCRSTGICNLWVSNKTCRQTITCGSRAKRRIGSMVNPAMDQPSLSDNDTLLITTPNNNYNHVNMSAAKRIKRNIIKGFSATAFCGLSLACAGTNPSNNTPVDYVNPYMGNISHLLVPTYPTVHLPNSFLRVYPERADFTGDRLRGLPLIVTSHRGRSAFNLSPFQGNEQDLRPVVSYSYDQEEIVPYAYSVYLDEQQTAVSYAVSHQSALYGLDFGKDGPAYVVVNSGNGALRWDGEALSGHQSIGNGTN